MPRKAIMGDVLGISDRNVWTMMNLGSKLSFEDTVLRYDQPLANANSSDLSRPVFHPNGTKLYVANGGATPWFRVIDLVTGTYKTNPATLPTGICGAIDLSPDGTELAITTTPSPYILRYDEATMIQKSAPAIVPNGQPSCAKYSPNGQYLAIGSTLGTGGTQGPLTVYETATMTPVTIAVKPSQYDLVYGIDWSPDGQYLCVCGENNSVYIYNTTTWARITTSTVPNISRILECKFSPNSAKIAFLSRASAAAANYMFIYTIAANTWKSQAMTAYQNYMSSNGGAGLKWAGNDDFIFYGGNSAATYAAAFFKYNITASTVEVLSHFYATKSNWALAYMPSDYRKLAGTVKGPGPSFTPLQRTVRATDRETGVKVGETISDPVTGMFDMRVYTNQPCTVVAIGSGSEVTKLYDSVIPAPLP